MRADDISTAKQVPVDHRTWEMYLPFRTPVSEMSLAQAKRGLCHKSGGDPHVCESCPAPCIIGKRVLELMGGAEDA